MTERHARRPELGHAAQLRRVMARYQSLVSEQAGDWEAFIAALQRPLPACIWAHPQRTDVAELQALIIAEEGGELPGLARDPWSPLALRLPVDFKAGQRWWYCAGLAHAQEAASQVPVWLLDVHPGQRVLDLCAAPGGKTAQIALALGNRGTLLANDFARERIAALQGNLDRLGIVNVSTTWGDGGNYPAAAGAFDRILVDAPCSSEGTLRRHRSLAARLDPDTLATNARLHGRQLALLRKAVQLCRAGGRILYSTCTFAPEENECIVAQVLEEQAGRLRLLPARLPGLAGRPGLTAWGGRTLDASLANCLRLWPHHTDTGGFFVAVMEKTPDAPQLEPGDTAVLDAGVDDECWLPALAEHYGWPETIWSGLRVQRQTRRGLHLLAADHEPPAQPSAQGRGLFFHRTNIRPPKLTTAGALLFGAQATRQVMELSQEQRDAYLRRASVTPRPQQWADCRPGQVIVRYRGHPLGVALLTRSRTLESLFPSRWSGCAGRS
ncbi:RsmB/NOP family class I SAM-dependent RNA methyltransferase [Rhabdochromatium marinum]|uniref:RsmB/NOP family class I SAM-dependent RNA methyltransferase n=1 Tax=Rhabdochromatium marinum TaxID=48729 RepID=UPI001907150C|nr:RsmB/NOP family class I SAM-dependent RNA methyltransferase [Rhabdochromatium marinum]MBK1648658.1 RNA methyltransferase [Rhabdochromatium marinum]